MKKMIERFRVLKSTARCKKIGERPKEKEVAAGPSGARCTGKKLLTNRGNTTDLVSVTRGRSRPDDISRHLRKGSRPIL